MRILNSFILLLKELKNFPLFWYHIHHYLNKYVPVSYAKRVANINKRQQSKQGVEDIYIQSIDGSNQVVHPDADLYRGKVAFVCTPYPYAMEEYENPCLYLGEDIHHLAPLLCPIDTQSEHAIGVHMSDPCIMVEDETIFCVYRDTRHKEDNVFIKEVCVNQNNEVKTKDRQLLYKEDSFFVLSPATVLSQSSLFMFYVKSDRSMSELILQEYSRDDYHIKEEKMVTVQYEPDGYSLWHIGIVGAQDLKKVVGENDRLIGLFLYMNFKRPNDLKLFTAESISDEYISWKIKGEIHIPDELREIIKFPYKSCFNPQNGKIILSFRDYKSRNRLIEIDVNI